MTGLIIRSTGSWHVVRTDDGQVVNCKVRGTFRLHGIKSTNPVAVGDIVDIEPRGDGTALITTLHDRRNYILRRSTNLSRRCHIIAANVDLAMLLVTVAHPETSTVFVDRFLATAEAYRVPAAIVFNKTDLLNTPHERARMEELLRLYEGLGYPCYPISAISGNLPAEFMDAIEGKTTLLSGNSGVGKSTLLNLLCPTAMARTAALSQAYDLGTHTTTLASMHPLPQGGHVIDTPGLKGFGAYDMTKAELPHYFREVFRTGQACRYTDCTHTSEPGCAVLRAVQDGSIALSRYRSYLSMLAEDTSHKYRPPQ